MEKQKRSKYLIDKIFQGQFMLRFSLIVVVSALLTLFVLWSLKINPYIYLPGGASVLVDINFNDIVPVEKNPDGSYSQKDSGSYWLFTPKKKPTSYNAFDLYWLPILAISLINILAIIIYSLFFSHKMAGPVHRIKKSLRDYIAQGVFSKISLRKKDHFKDLADLVNRAILKEDGNEKNK